MRLICLMLGFTENFWIGATSLGNQNHFYWMGSTNGLNFTDWADGTPEEEKKYCIEILVTDDLKWSGEKCWRLKNFICEKLTAVPS